MTPQNKNIHLACKYWLEDQEGTSLFGEGKLQLLKAIDETGSFKAALGKLGLSYRKTWDNIKKIEERLGFPLIITTRGGKEGGSSELSEEARAIIHAFESISHELKTVVDEMNKRFLDQLNTIRK